MTQIKFIKQPIPSLRGAKRTKQSILTSRLDGLLRFARNDDKIRCRLLAAQSVRVVHEPFAPEKQRAQGKPGARCTRSLAWCVKNTRVSHHRFTGTPGLPCAMVLTVSFALSPVIGLSCHRRQRITPPT